MFHHPPYRPHATARVWCYWNNECQKPTTLVELFELIARLIHTSAKFLCNDVTLQRIISRRNNWAATWPAARYPLRSEVLCNIWRSCEWKIYYMISRFFQITLRSGGSGLWMTSSQSRVLFWLMFSAMRLTLHSNSPPNIFTVFVYRKEN